MPRERLFCGAATWSLNYAASRGGRGLPAHGHIALARVACSRSASRVAALWPALADGLGSLGAADALGDCGRLAPGSAVVSQVLPRSGLVVVVAASSPAGVVHLHHRLAALPPAVVARTTVILVGEGHPGCRATDVERALGVEVAGVLADDWRGAEALAGGEVSTRRYRASALARSARPLARALAARLGSATTADPPPAPGVLGDRATLHLAAWR